MSSFSEQMIAVVGNLDFSTEPVDEFVHTAFVILAAALAKLHPEDCEAYLEEIERGDLRKAIERFEPCHRRSAERLN